MKKGLEPRAELPTCRGRVLTGEVRIVVIDHGHVSSSSVSWAAAGVAHPQSHRLRAAPRTGPPPLTGNAPVTAHLGLSTRHLPSASSNGRFDRVRTHVPLALDDR
jgi:hypothetical protein